jgi:ERF superfamily
MAESATPLSIHAALAAVMRDVVPVGKDQVNAHQRYSFRGIDDLMSAVAGPMRAHGVFLLPEVVEKSAERDGKMTTVRLTMRYTICGPAGDSLTATVPGEAMDSSDKATNKAMSAALKYFLLQVLMIPVDGRSIDDGDRDHPERPERRVAGQPQVPTQKQLAKLADGAMREADVCTDAEVLRALYRKAAEERLLEQFVPTTTGDMTLAEFLASRAAQLRSQQVAA